MRPSRLVGTAVSLLILAAGLSACGDPNAPNPENTPALAGKAATSTPARHAAKPGLRRMNRAQVLKALAAGPTKKRFAHLDLELRTRADTVTGSGDMAYSPTNPAIDLELAGSCLCVGDVEVVVADHSMYLHAPVQPDGVYTRLDPLAPKGMFTPGFRRLSSELDPLSALLAMRPGFREVHFAGHSSMYGVPMSTYTLVVDGNVGLRARGRTLQPGMQKKMHYRLWFGEHHMLRKITLHWSGMRMKAEMSDWGKPVRVHAPRPSQLTG